ncbi:CHAD domain-containing protein [Deinococcus yavapaiensis]|uniref:CHAD domain-containing protein n=1 Tax=Deinococcus yavapaiensis KR-236 TaxID=694435 RepID=A0A318SAK2_9DEIO|nr:CHAD domain-containing protein [Deinococcus yavapaiensis]PYE55240.1 CHAD domain-containing protein [Deinococcus yavapaiensis KR-236]
MSKRHKELERLWPDLVKGDEKAIHEVRKLSRKVGAELRAAGAPNKVRRAWRDLRRAIASVRDRDAVVPHLVEGLRALGASEEDVRSFGTAWKAKREEAFRSVTLPEPPPEFKVDVDLAKRARKKLPGDLDKVREDAVHVLVSDDADTWHEWRKDLKRLRHTLELVAEPPRSMLDLLQALGRLQDAEVTKALLSEFDGLPGYKEALLRREDEAASESKRAAREAWATLEDDLAQFD